MTKVHFDGSHMPLTGRPDTIASLVDGTARGFNTPSRKLELYSETGAEWGWPELATPTYARSHVHHSQIDHAQGEYVLLPTYRLPTMIHSRSANAKYLTELAHTHPLLVCPRDAERIGLTTGSLARVETEIGWFVIKALVTDGIRPGVVAASHHMGRWRLKESNGMERWSSALVDMIESNEAVDFHRVHGVRPFTSSGPSSERIWWSDAGVHQNITFPVHPDPVSGMHCWHQKVRVRASLPGDAYADIHVDFAKARAVYRKWLATTRPAKDDLRRPIWLVRPLKPHVDAYALPDDERTAAARDSSRDRTSALELYRHVDWNPAAVWGPLDAVAKPLGPAAHGSGALNSAKGEASAGATTPQVAHRS